MSPGAGTLSLHILSSEHGEPLMPPFSLHAVHSSRLGSAWLLLAFLVKVLFQLLLWTPLPPPAFCSVRERIQITLSEKEAESSETTVCKKPAKPIQGDISLFFFFFSNNHFGLSENVKLPQKSADADKVHWVTEWRLIYLMRMPLEGTDHLMLSSKWKWCESKSTATLMRKQVMAHWHQSSTSSASPFIPF